MRRSARNRSPLRPEYPVYDPDSAPDPEPHAPDWSLPGALVPHRRQGPSIGLASVVPSSIGPSSVASSSAPPEDGLDGQIMSWYRRQRADRLEGVLQETRRDLAACLERQQRMAKGLDSLLGTLDERVEKELALCISEYQRESLREIQEAAQHARDECRASMTEALQAAWARERSLAQAVLSAQTQNRALRRRLQELRGAREEADQRRRDQERQRDSHARLVAGLEAQVLRLKDEARTLQAERVAGPWGAARLPPDLPATVAQTLRFFGSLQRRVRFSGTALRMAEECGDGDPALCWRGLVALHDELWAILHEENDLAATLLFYERTGLVYSGQQSAPPRGVDEVARPFGHVRFPCRPTGEHLLVHLGLEEDEGALVVRSVALEAAV